MPRITDPVVHVLIMALIISVRPYIRTGGLTASRAGLIILMVNVPILMADLGDRTDKGQISRADQIIPMVNILVLMANRGDRTNKDQISDRMTEINTVVKTGIVVIAVMDQGMITVTGAQAMAAIMAGLIRHVLPLDCHGSIITYGRYGEFPRKPPSTRRFPGVKTGGGHKPNLPAIAISQP